jgi:HlyD family secretion protein
MKRFLFPVFALVIVGATVAQVKATRAPQITPPSAQASMESQRITVEGRLVTYPGYEVTVGSDFAGTVERVLVNEKDVVRKGDVLAIVRADDTRAALAESRARVGEAEADIRLFELETERAKNLWREDIGSKETWEKTERDLDAARARRASATAEVRRLEAVLAKTQIVAPIDGTVTSRIVHPGEAIVNGAPIVTLANLTKTRVEAEVDEFDTSRVSVGAKAFVTAEGFDGKQWRGTVEEIPDTVTSRRLKPQDTSKPIDTRVLLVKVALDEATPLKLGQRVEVAIAR